MKRVLTAFIITLCFAFPLTAQVNQYTSAKDIDPEAKALLTQVRNKYDAYKTLEVDFSMDIQFADRPVESQKGTLVRQGEKYFMSLGDIDVLCNGEAIWFILKNNREVQINPMPDPAEQGSMILSPDAMFNFYDNGSFVYALINETMENGKRVQQIEFKPLDKNAEYAKLRLNVNKTTKEITSVFALGKDGSRYNLQVNRFLPDRVLATDAFVFNPSKYEGFHIEDLR
jgi:outer membrane lipoprotein carrier protein